MKADNKTILKGERGWRKLVPNSQKPKKGKYTENYHLSRMAHMMTRMTRWLDSHDSLARWLTVCQDPNIYVGSHKRNVKTMIVNSSNSLSRGESGERANVARSYSATIQNNNTYTKSNLNVI